MEKQQYIGLKIHQLISEGKSADKAVEIANKLWRENYSMQKGGDMPMDENKTIAPQKPIFKIQRVTTQEYKDGNKLPPGDYFKVYYTDPNRARVENQDFEYVDASGYQGMQDMNNFKLYMQSLKNSQPLAIRQEGGNWYENNPPLFASNNYSLPKPPISDEGIYTPQIDNQTYVPTTTNDNSQIIEDTIDNKKYKINQNVLNGDYNNEDFFKYNLLNPFGGSYGLEQSLSFAGKSFGEGKTGEGLMGSGLFLLKGARNFLSGYGAGKANKRLANTAEDKLYNSSPNHTVLQEGGKHTVADLMTGQFITDTPNPNVEIEADEKVKDGETGEVKTAIGEKHDNGGIEVNLPNDSKVLSDFTKIGATNAKYFSSTYNIKAKATDTFAKVMDKIENKIGVKEIIDEEKEYFKEVEKASKIEDSTTRQLNLEFLSKEIADIQEKKMSLQKEQSTIFEDVFKKQEAIPKKGDGKTVLKKQEGGLHTAQEEQIEGQASNPQEEQGEITPDQIIQSYAEISGIDPQTIVAELQKLSPEKQQQALQEMYNAVNPQPMMQEGGRIPNKYENPDLYINQTATDSEWNSFGELMKNNPKEVLSEIKRIHPELYQKYFPNGKVDKNKVAEFQLAVNKKYDNILKDAASIYPVDSPEYKNLVAQVEKDKFIVDTDNTPNIRKTDALFGNYTATRPNYALQVLPKDVLNKVNKEGINTSSELKAKYPDLFKKYIQGKGLTSDFWLGEIPTPTNAIETTPTPTTTSTEDLNLSNTTTQQNQRIKNVIPDIFTPFRMPPSAVVNPFLQQVYLGRDEAQKGSVENSLVANRNAMQSAYEQTKDLPPALRASVLANLFNQEQAANTNAIATQEVTDRADANRARLFNISQSDKEKILNENLKKQYEKEVFATQNLSENAWNRYFNAIEGDRRQSFNDIRDMNLLNATTDNFQTTGSSIDFVNPPKFNLENEINKRIKELFDAAKTPEEKTALQKRLTEYMSNPK